MDGNKRTALATCLVFLSENGLLPEETLKAGAWEQLVMDVTGSRVDREETTVRLRRLLSLDRVGKGNLFCNMNSRADKILAFIAILMALRIMMMFWTSLFLPVHTISWQLRSQT